MSELENTHQKFVIGPDGKIWGAQFNKMSIEDYAKVAHFLMSKGYSTVDKNVITFECFKLLLTGEPFYSWHMIVAVAGVHCMTFSALPAHKY